MKIRNITIPLFHPYMACKGFFRSRIRFDPQSHWWVLFWLVWWSKSADSVEMIGPLAVPQWNWRQFFACFGVWSEMKLPLSPLLLQNNSSTLSTMVSWQSRLQNWALKQDIFSTSSFASRLNVPCSLAHYFSGTIHYKSQGFQSLRIQWALNQFK